MKDQNFTDEVSKILQDAPNARKALLENYDNLLKVSEYCNSNYIQSGDGSMKALEETKNFTTQSLASVAYQISTLASSVLSLLDAQTNQLRHMESSINMIGQTVEMHKEKVSRREIGVFTAARRVPRSHKILFPPQPPAGMQPRPPYSRQTIDYEQLDSLGHGIKVSGKQSDRTGTIRKPGSSIRSNKGPEPVQCPVVPSVSRSSFGTPATSPTIPSTWQAPPDLDIVTTVLDEAPPPPTSDDMSAHDNEVANTSAPPPPPPPPDLCGQMMAPPPPPPEALPNHNASPLSLETVVEENILPPPSPPPPPPPSDDDDGVPLLTNDGSELPAPPPPPPPCQELNVTFSSRSSRRHRSPPSTRSLSMRVRSGPSSRCRYTRSLFLPAVQSLMIPPPPSYPPPRVPPLPAPSPSSSYSSFMLLNRSSSPWLCLRARLEHLDLEIPDLPPPLLLDNEGGFDDIMPPLPPPVDYDTNAPPHYLEKVVALHSYKASKPDDLSLTEGDIIYLTHRHDDGWFEGFLHGNQGFFPGNYVQSYG